MPQDAALDTMIVAGLTSEVSWRHSRIATFGGVGGKEGGAQRMMSGAFQRMMSFAFQRLPRPSQDLSQDLSEPLH